MSWKYGDEGDVPVRWSRERKIEALLPVARIVAKKSGRKGLNKLGMEEDDVFGAAMLGVIKAVDAYNPARGRLTSFAFLCAYSAVNNEGDRYNPTSRTFRERGEYVTLVSSEFSAATGEGDWDMFEPVDETADVEAEVLAGADFEEVWANWSQALTAIQAQVADVAVRRLGNARAGHGERHPHFFEEVGLPYKQVDNAMMMARKGLRRAFLKQGVNPDTATMAELLAVRLPPRTDKWAH